VALIGHGYRENKVTTSENLLFFFITLKPRVE